MFDMGFQELLLIGVIALLVMGPERLPGAVRSASLWISRLRRSFQQIKADIEREIDADDLKRELHNQSIMQSLEQTKTDLSNSLGDSAEQLKPALDKLEYDIKDIIEPATPQDSSPATDADSDPAPNHKPVNHHD